MNKLSDQIQAALDRKRGTKHPDTDDAPVVEKKLKNEPNHRRVKNHLLEVPVAADNV